VARGLGRLLALIALAALYGTLHDQVSYGLGPDYFTCLKFPQFGLLDTALAPHWRAARVGLQAGAVAGLPLGLALLWLARGRPAGDRYLRRGSAAVLLGALGCAVLGLGLGWLVLQLGSVQQVPACVQDPRGFLLAAWMHGGSYLGALLGLLVFAWRNRLRR
jgi:hypothetical protein